MPGPHGRSRNSRGRMKSEKRFNLQKGKKHVNANSARFRGQDERKNVQAGKQLRRLRLPLTSMLQAFVAMPGHKLHLPGARALITHEQESRQRLEPPRVPQWLPHRVPHVRAPRPPSKLPGALTPASPHGQVCSLPSTGPSPQGPFLGPDPLPPAGPPFRDLSPEAQSALQGMRQATV